MYEGIASRLGAAIESEDVSAGLSMLESLSVNENNLSSHKPPKKPSIGLITGDQIEFSL